MTESSQNVTMITSSQLTAIGQLPKGGALGGRLVRFFLMDSSSEGQQTGNGKQMVAKGNGGNGNGGKGKFKGNGVYNRPRCDVHVAGGPFPQDVFMVRTSAILPLRRMDIDVVTRCILHSSFWGLLESTIIRDPRLE